MPGDRGSADLDDLVGLGGQLDRPGDLDAVGLLDLDLIRQVAGQLEGGRVGDFVPRDESTVEPDVDLSGGAGGLEGDLASEGVAPGDVLGGDVAGGSLPDHREIGV